MNDNILLHNALIHYVGFVKKNEMKIIEKELPPLEVILNNSLIEEFYLILQFSKVLGEEQLIIDFLKEHNLAELIEFNSVSEILNMIYFNIQKLQNPKITLAFL